MATNWPQQVNPRACRSALCVCTADWNSKRENNCRSCENILLTRVKADPPSLKSVAKPDDNLSEAQPFFGISFQIVIWTRVLGDRQMGRTVESLDQACSGIVARLVPCYWQAAPY